MRNSLIIVALVSLILSGCTSSKEVTLIEKTDITKSDFVDENALHDAVRARDLKSVKFLVAQDISVDNKNINGYTPLHIAVRLKEYEIAKFLIENNASVNTIDNYSDTPLLDSTRDNYDEISKLLICNGAKRDVVDKYGMSPLNNSMKSKDLDLSKMLRADNVDSLCGIKDEIIEEEVVEEEKTNAVVFVGLYDALMEEFKDDFAVWNAELTKDDLLFRFNNPIALFQVGKSDLKVEFTEVLKDFFPRYVTIINAYKDQIKEIRVEGHSSSEYAGVQSDERKYLLNQKLSETRATKVRNYAVNETLQDSTIEKEWVDTTFIAYGMSSSNLILNEDGTENVKASRRVDFRIVQLDK
ncbi:MAG: ankyrin repeat domain-containing protein [Arcobacteraceae bacterium]